MIACEQYAEGYLIMKELKIMQSKLDKANLKEKVRFTFLMVGERSSKYLNEIFVLWN